MAMVITCCMLSLVTWTMLWVNLAMFEPVMGLVSVFFPPLLYRYLLRMWLQRSINENWEHFRTVVVTHLCSVLLSLMAVGALSTLNQDDLRTAQVRLEKTYGISLNKYIWLMTLGRSRV
jgi:uncharacterized membrane protein